MLRMQSKKPRQKERPTVSTAKYVRKNWRLYTMLIVMFGSLLVFNYLPMAGLQLAFKDWVIPIGNQAGGVWGSPWATDAAGNLDLFKHFRTLFTNPDVFGTFLNTLRISLLRLLIGFPMPILLALFLNELTSNRVRKVVQSFSYLPHFISWVIIAGILKDLTSPTSSLQQLLSSIFGHEIEFFGNSDLFLGMLIVSDIWKNVGWGTIIYFAALANINPELYEAGRIDGASRWKLMRHITLPGIVPAISINLIFATSGIVYGGFDQIYNLYNPLVYDKADILETYLFRNGAIGGDYPLATAMGMFNSVIAFILIITANKVIRKIGGDGIW
jgi:putative aldouronate transport system permease protein